MCQEAQAVWNSTRYTRATAEIQVAQCGQMAKIWWNGSSQPGQIRYIQHPQLTQLPKFRWNLASKAVAVHIKECQIFAMANSVGILPEKPFLDKFSSTKLHMDHQWLSILQR
jgi:hypothetical protein